MDASFFRANHTYGDEHAFIEGVTFSDEQKVNIVPGTERVFFDFLREHKQSVFPGGGGRNSAYVLSRLGQEVSYFDTSSEPDFELGFNGQKYFANMGHPCRALVLRSPTGTVNIRSTRGDRSKKLEGDFREKLVDFLAQGHDFFVNSLSNEDLALTVAREAKGSLYALVTDHLHRDHRALDRLVQRANSLFFSFSDFYSFAGISPSIDRDKAVDRSTTERVVGDISSMVYDRGLVSPIFVTMGGDGVIAYDPIKSREGIF
jgi:sugar/nucleoside kinase (ribokinase family)